MPVTWTFADNAFTTLTSPVASTTQGASESWAVTTTGAPFPAVSTGVNQFAAVITPAVGSDASPEIVLVTNTVNATHWQVTRQYGGAIKAHSSGDVLTLIIDLGWLSAMESYRVARASATIAVSQGTGAYNIDASLGNIYRITLTGNAGAATIINPPTGITSYAQDLTICYIQDISGSRSYSWPTNCRFAGNSAPTATTTPYRMDTVTFIWDGGASPTNVWEEVHRAVNVPVV